MLVQSHKNDAGWNLIGREIRVVERLHIEHRRVLIDIVASFHVFVCGKPSFADFGEQLATHLKNSFSEWVYRITLLQFQRICILCCISYSHPYGVCARCQWIWRKQKYWYNGIVLRLLIYLSSCKLGEECAGNGPRRQAQFNHCLSYLHFCYMIR